MRRVDRRSERGNAALMLVVAMAFAAILAALAADVARASAARGRAQAAADAAALAAAQELVVPSDRTPTEVAEEYAERNGARLVSCACEPGGSDVVVTVELDVHLPLLQETRTVTAMARAVVATPAGSAGLQPWFAARLACLFTRVEGLWIISGFRTRAEQALLYRRKPGLAAPPGHSNHELGLAADLAYADAAARREAHDEAGGCGLEFPMSYEPWHIEPVEL